MTVRVLIAAALAWALALPAQAAWYRAETPRFIIYGEGGESKVRQYADKLTKFDGVLRLFHPAAKDKPTWTKMQVVIVDARSDLRRVRPDLNRDVAGVYMASNEGVFAIAVDDDLGRDDTLFHEYAHHFMLENFPVAYPGWYVEGFAEYFMTAEVRYDGVKVGGYNPWRAQAVFNEPWLPWSEIFTKRPLELPRSKTNSYYAQSWLLTHFMHNGDRAAKLDAAIRKIAAGAEPVATFWAETGYDEESLTKALRRYQQLSILKIMPASLPATEVAVTRMPASADDLFLDDLRLMLGPSRELDEGFLRRVRQRAAKHPGDRLAQITLARAEYAMGDIAAGGAAIKPLLAAHPDDREVLLNAGWGLILAGIREPATREARWKAARPLFGKAYAADKTDFRPMYAYALSRSIEPTFPTDNDLAVLLEARGLAPAVQENSLRAGLALLAKGRREEAVRVLGPVINNPHGGAAAAGARAMLEGKGGVNLDRLLGIDKEDAGDAEGEGTTPPGPGAPPPA